MEAFISVEEPFFFFGRGRPGEESANGRRAVGVKVDVVGVGGGGMGGGVLGWGWGGVAVPNGSCLFRITRLRIRLWSELSGRLVLLGLWCSEGLEFDSSSEGGGWGSILRLAL